MGKSNRTQRDKDQAPPQILVIDDDKVFRGLLKTVLELEGYQTILTSQLHEVIPQAHQARPDLILMDVHIAREDTLGLLEMLRRDDVLKSVPIIMTSGMDRSRECLDAGADAFLLKPFRPSEALKMINDLLTDREDNGKKEQRETPVETN